MVENVSKLIVFPSDDYNKSKEEVPTSMGEYSEKIKSPFTMIMNELFCMCISFA